MHQHAHAPPGLRASSLGRTENQSLRDACSPPHRPFPKSGNFCFLDSPRRRRPKTSEPRHAAKEKGKPDAQHLFPRESRPWLSQNLPLWERRSWKSHAVLLSGYL